jgi:hypothetical protein
VCSAELIWGVAEVAHFCSMEITQGEREYAASHMFANINEAREKATKENARQFKP